MVKVHSEVIGLAGGPKQKWLREHRQEVMAYYHEHGPNSTMDRYNMRQTTLQNFFTGKPVNYEKLTKADRALAISQMAIEGTREVRHRVAEIERQYEHAAPLLQIGYGIIDAMKQLMPEKKSVRLRVRREESLSLTDFSEKSEKRS